MRPNVSWLKGKGKAGGSSLQKPTPTLSFSSVGRILAARDLGRLWDVPVVTC